MTQKTQQGSKAVSNRYAQLKGILEERRKEILDELKIKMREARSDIPKGDGVGDLIEASSTGMDDDIEFALIQMRQQTLGKIEDALARHTEGTYGNCFECGDEIAERRLRALPFAVRCKDCEEAREIAERRQRAVGQRPISGFPPN